MISSQQELHQATIFMKESTLILFLVVLAWNCYSQGREDLPSVKWTVRSPKLTSATGYNFNHNTGKWISNKNAIYPNPALQPLRSKIEQNFLWIQTGKVANEFESHILLLFEKPSGRYKYPAIEDGWIEEKRTYWYEIDSMQYTALFNLLNNKAPGELIIGSNYHDFITDSFVVLEGEYEYTDANLRANITKILRVGGDDKHCFKVQYIADPNGDLVRFVLPYEICATMERKFEKGYFEVPAASFKSMMIKP
jgi:hypothetical protein